MSILRASSALLRAGGGIGRIAGSESLSELTLSDIEYMGMYKFPYDDGASSIRVSHGRGPGGIAIRRGSGGDLRFICTLAPSVNQNLYELSLPVGAPTTDLATAPRLITQKHWGDAWEGDAQGIWRRYIPQADNNSAAGQNSEGSSINGMLWDGEKLVWCQGANYIATDHRTIGCVTIPDSFSSSLSSGDKHGTWRLQNSHAKKSNGFLMEIPSEVRSRFGGHNIMVGALSTSVNQPNAYGMAMRSFSSSNLLSITNDDHWSTASRSIEDTVWLDCNQGEDSNGPIAQAARMVRNATYKQCTKGWGGNVDPLHNYNCADGTSLTGLLSHCCDIDMFLGAHWIRRNGKEGILALGNFVDQDPDTAWRTAHYNGDDYPHWWYGNENATCCHGQTGYISGTGPHSPSYLAQFFIYNASNITDVAKTPLQRTNSYTVGHKNLKDYSSYFYSASEYYMYGSAYDPITGLLYVRQDMLDTVSQGSYEPLPVLHVFRIAGA